jgi:hypothetical protein
VSSERLLGDSGVEGASDKLGAIEPGIKNLPGGYLMVALATANPAGHCTRKSTCTEFISRLARRRKAAIYISRVRGGL